MITKYFVIFGSFILLSVIVFADLFKMIMIPNDSYWVAMKVVPLIILANFFLGIYTNLSVWYKLIDKTYIGAYISIRCGNYIGFKFFADTKHELLWISDRDLSSIRKHDVHFVLFGK